MWESMSPPFFQVLYNLVRDFFYALVYRMFVPIAIGIGSPPFFSEACLEKDRLSFLYEQHRRFETLHGKNGGGVFYRGVILTGRGKVDRKRLSLKIKF